jgi:glycosyltransferase involved in cell wall biosynthesis
MLRLAWSGVHVHRKALPILLEALALVPDHVRWELDVLGDGPQNARWRHLAERLGLASRCRWHGWLPHAASHAILRHADLFCFPSLLEGTPNVVLESLSLGVPVICFDHCGQAGVVDESCGVTIAVQPARLAARRYAEAVTRLASAPDHLDVLRQGALARARQHAPDCRAEAMTSVYERALGERRAQSAA